MGSDQKFYLWLSTWIYQFPVYVEPCKTFDHIPAACVSVGSVIWRKKELFVYIISKNSLNFSRSLICNKFILKSLAIVAYLFSFCNLSIRGENSMNFEMFLLLLLSEGGLYILSIANDRLRLGPETSRNRPSYMSRMFIWCSWILHKIIV